MSTNSLSANKQRKKCKRALRSSVRSNSDSLRLTTQQSERLYCSLVEKFLPGLGLADHPDATLLLEHLRGRNYAKAVALADSFTKQCYGSSEEHFRWNQVASLVKKMPFVDPSLTPESTATAKFLAAEHSCYRVNQRLRAWQKRRGERKKALPYGALLGRAKLWITALLGEEPNLPEIYNLCDFGPGASVGVHGNSTNIGAKLHADDWSVTPGCLPYALAALKTNSQIWQHLLGVYQAAADDPRDSHTVYCVDPVLFDRRVQERVKLVGNNIITFVPKSATTHRSIAIEPLLNGFVQKGVDQYMKRLLARRGIDLIHGQAANASLAYLGSIQTPGPATIDLSAASDSLSIELVRLLLPPAWFDFLNSLRSPSYVTSRGGSPVRYEKFASMGNGFCFPLETAVFASLAYAVNTVTGESMLKVYGDDIIVHQSSALLLIELLSFCGFRTNVDKTFVHGPFRESCGSDFYDGKNVRPVIVDEFPMFWDDVYKILNGIRRRGLNHDIWYSVLQLVPERVRFLRPTPTAEDDNAINCELDLFMGSKPAKWCPLTQRFKWREVVRRPVLDKRVISVGVAMATLLRGSRPGPGYQPSLHLRHSTTRTVKWV